MALRYDNWKLTFQEQRAEGFDVWQEPFVPLRLPRLCNLRSDPFEQAHEIGIGYSEWRIDRAFLLVPAQQIVGKFLATFKEYPPSQKVGSFSLDQVMESLACRHGRQVTHAVAERREFRGMSNEPNSPADPLSAGESCRLAGWCRWIFR